MAGGAGLGPAGRARGGSEGGENLENNVLSGTFGLCFEGSLVGEQRGGEGFAGRDWVLLIVVWVLQVGAVGDGLEGHDQRAAMAERRVLSQTQIDEVVGRILTFLVL